MDQERMKQIDDECFAAAETLVASVFAGASHRERIELVLEIATPIFSAVKAAVAKSNKTVTKAPAKKRGRRTKAQIMADKVGKAITSPAERERAGAAVAMHGTPSGFVPSMPGALGQRTP